ncbi:hypothetical protein [Ramlibacter humi]|uniref:Uncharacterized protein n=1 Tax=Ramlibacter humi TaxID=2530451 RepID=A0A4Z0BVJ8_9BURK|nr:hypothetical protein [Ramlibacter humi]TFZ02065.1 hypothetical protein EZ216_12885 [Ramlibacter humi]
MNNAKRLAVLLSAAMLLSGTARAANDAVHASAAVSVAPVASVVVGSAALSAAAVAVPVTLSAAGATLVVKGVEASAKGTVYVLERVSDGARISVEVAGRVADGASRMVDKTVVSTVVASGIVLSAAGEVIAFIPNELGKALMHNERVTN